VFLTASEEEAGAARQIRAVRKRDWRRSSPPNAASLIVHLGDKSDLFDEQ
jgi:hypothetical protein